MNIGASTLTQPATIGGSGGVSMIDPQNQGWQTVDRAYQAGDRLGEVGFNYVTAILKAGDVASGTGNFVGIDDSTAFLPIIAMDYDTSVFATGGALKWADVNGVHKGALYAGAGVPNNAGGVNGDFALRQDGAAGTSIYMKRAGAWVGIL